VDPTSSRDLRGAFRLLCRLLGMDQQKYPVPDTAMSNRTACNAADSKYVSSTCLATHHVGTCVRPRRPTQHELSEFARHDSSANLLAHTSIPDKETIQEKNGEKGNMHLLVNSKSYWQLCRSLIIHLSDFRNIRSSTLLQGCLRLKDYLKIRHPDYRTRALGRKTLGAHPGWNYQ
jgi:hypothetical protein